MRKMASKLSTFDLFKNLKYADSVELSEEDLKKLQDTLRSILADVDAFCRKHGIVYSLGGGSCLGAVRHQDMIPWDDDIDINMDRENYEKFIRTFLQEYGDRYWLHTPEYTDNYGLQNARIRLKGTSVKTKEDLFTDECGAMLDLFVLENTYDSKILRGIHGFGAMAFGFLLSCRKFYRDRDFLLKLSDDPEVLSVFRKKIRIGAVISFLSMNTWTRACNNWNRMCRNGKSKYIAIPAGRKHFWGETYLRDDLCTMVPAKFGALQSFIPKGYDMYLRRLYGDYQKIPAESEREAHVFLKPFKL